MTSKLKLVLISAAIVGLSATAFAKKGDGQMHPRRAAMLAKFDANNDGTLDASEKAKLVEARKAMKAQKRSAMLAKFDVNKDGTLDQSERGIAREQRVEQRFAKIDANNDGVVTLAEMKAAKPAKRGGHKRGHKHGPGLIK